MIFFYKSLQYDFLFYQINFDKPTFFEDIQEAKIIPIEIASPCKSFLLEFKK